MIEVPLSYSARSGAHLDPDRAALGLATSRHRAVRFDATIREGAYPLRLALLALAAVVEHSDRWDDEETWASRVLDPVVTVHPDRVWFEVFSADRSSWAAVVAPRSMFDARGEVRCGTTNVDFTFALTQALGELRTRRETRFIVAPDGWEVSTAGGGTVREEKVPVPEPWLRAYVSLQAAMAMPGTRLAVRPVELLGVIRFLRHHKAKISPRALRWELLAGGGARLIVEPWERAFPLKIAEHGFIEPRAIRTWGRRRLSLLEPLLPYAEGVTAYLKGRAMPTFYDLALPGGLRFVLGLSGHAGNAFDGGRLERLLDARAPAEDVARAHGWLAARYHGDPQQIADALGWDLPRASAALSRLCLEGRALFDVVDREWRHRELLAQPLDVEALFPPDEQALLAEGLVPEDVSGAVRESKRTRRWLQTPEGREYREIVHRDWVVDGRVGGYPVHAVLNDEDRVIFGTCACPFFREHLLARGPCAHLIALARVGASIRRELPTSEAASPPDEPAEAAP